MSRGLAVAPLTPPERAETEALSEEEGDWIGLEEPAVAAKAQRLLYQLDLPAEAAKVLCHDRYWTLAFLHRFLDRCDRERLRDPQAAYRMAYLSVQLASLVPLGVERGGYRDSSHGVRWQLYSRLVCAGACRASDRHVEARGFFAVVADNLASGGTWVRAQYSLRFAHLLVAEGSALAGEEIDRALSLLRSTRGPDRDGAVDDAILLRGVFRCLRGLPGGMTDFAHVLRESDRTTESGRQRFQAGLFNLLGATALDGKVHLEDQRDAYRLLQEVRKMTPPGRRNIRKAYIAWTEGRLLRNLGNTAASIRAFRRTLRMLAGLELPLEMAWCTLDLADLLVEEGRSRALEPLLEQTLSVLRAGGAARGDDLEQFVELLETAIAEKSLDSWRSRDLLHRASPPGVPGSVAPAAPLGSIVSRR